MVGQRNASLGKWIVEQHMLGSMGMGHPAVDGYLIDDWYTDYKGEFGPSEIPGFIGPESGQFSMEES